MKQLNFLAVLLLFLGIQVYGQVNIPDANFKNALIASGIDTNSDGEIQFSEANATLQINVQFKNISSLNGIASFTNLRSLNCRGNQLTNLDISANTKLKRLFCEKNQLTSLDVTNNLDLTRLFCTGNKITTLNVNQNTNLTHLDCGDNELTTIDVTNNLKLQLLSCIRNQINSLDITNNTELRNLNCSETGLISLNISQNPKLVRLNCDLNNITALDVTNNTNLITLHCFSTDLNALDVRSNLKLEELTIVGTKITEIDVTQNTNLKVLNLNNNDQLESLDVTQNPLLELMVCRDTKIPILDFSQNPNLKIIDFVDNSELTYISIKNGVDFFSGDPNCLQTFFINANPKLEQICVDASEKTCIESKIPSFSNISVTTDCSLTSSCSVIVSIPDTNFEQALIDLNIDSDGVINGQVCKQDVERVEDLNISFKNITSITGIEAFINLEKLTLIGNKVSNIDVSKLKFLEELSFPSNLVSNINLSNNIELRSLIFSGNPIRSLNVSYNLKLKTLYTASSNITTLNLYNNRSLEKLISPRTSIEKLDLSNNTKLKEINVSNNGRLKSLNIKNGTNTILRKVEANNNANLTCIEVDNVNYANNQANWKKDNTAIYSKNCDATIIPGPITNFNCAILKNELQLNWKSEPVAESYELEIERSSFSGSSISSLNIPQANTAFITHIITGSFSSFRWRIRPIYSGNGIWSKWKSNKQCLLAFIDVPFGRKNLTSTSVNDQEISITYDVNSKGKLLVNGAENKNTSISIYDLNGRELYTNKGNITEIDLIHLNLDRSMYLLKINTGTKVFTKKLVR